MSTTISGTSGVTFPDSTSMQTGQQACKAWVNFNGTGTVAIRAAYNVSSITDNATGQYTVNFTTAMPDANYPTVVTGGRNLGGGGAGLGGYLGASNDAVPPTTSGVRVTLQNYNLADSDSPYVSVSVFR